MEPLLGVLDLSGPLEGGLDAAFDFDLGFKEDFGKEADRGGGVKPAFAVVAAASESPSGAILKNGLSLSRSSICAWATAGGAFAAPFVAGGDFTSGAPFGFGFTSADETVGAEVESVGKVTSAMVESCPDEVEVTRSGQSRSSRNQRGLECPPPLVLTQSPPPPVELAGKVVLPPLPPQEWWTSC